MASIYFYPTNYIETGESLTISIEDIGWTNGLSASEESYSVAVYAGNKIYQQWTISYGIESSIKSITAPSYECAITVKVTRHVSGAGQFNEGSESISVVESSSSGGSSGGGSGGSGGSSSYSPTIGSITLTPVDNNGNKMNYAIQGISRIKVEATGCYANSGYISSYTFSGPNLTQTYWTSSSYCDAISNIVTSYGTLYYYVTVRNSDDGSTRSGASIKCYDYTSPSFTYFRAYRSDANGNADMKGTYVAFEYSIQCTSIAGSNKTTMAIYCGNTQVTSGITSSSGRYVTKTSSYNISTQYDFYAIVTDTYGGTGKSEYAKVYPSGKILNVAANGQSIGVGGEAPSNKNGVLECYWGANFKGNVDVSEYELKSKNLSVSGISTFTNKPTWSGWTAPEIQTGVEELHSNEVEKTIYFKKAFTDVPSVIFTPTYGDNGGSQNYVYLKNVYENAFNIGFRIYDDIDVYWTAIYAP